MTSLKKQKSQSGQAVVEYVLLLAISVALILGLANQLYRPFGGWLKNYMGAYLECLLDVGELPSLGGGDTTGECNSKFQSFTAAGGRPPLDSKTPNKDGSDNKDQQAKSAETDSGGSSGGGSGGRTAGVSTSFVSRKGAGADSGKKASEQEIMEKLPETKYMKFRSQAGAPSTFQQRIEAQGIAGIPMMEKEKLKRTAESSFQVKAPEEMSDGKKGKTLIVKPPERKVASEEPDQPWGFSQYLKMAVILAIIVAIVLFLGGQILQISKGSEK